MPGWETSDEFMVRVTVTLCPAGMASCDWLSDSQDAPPHWLYPGPAAIERHMPIYPLSRDLERYTRLKKDLTLYRLTLGQPRQEDMLALLEDRGVDPEAVTAIDLRPPASQSNGE